MLPATCLLLFGVLSALAPSYSLLLLSRMMVGVGIGGAAVAFSLCSEFLPSSSREFWLVAIEFFWTVSGPPSSIFGPCPSVLFPHSPSLSHSCLDCRRPHPPPSSSGSWPSTLLWTVSDRPIFRTRTASAVASPLLLKPLGTHAAPELGRLSS